MQILVKVICPLLFSLVLLVRQCRTLDFLQLPFIAGRRFPCRGAEADSHGPCNRKTMETPQLQYVSWWSMPLLCRSCLLCPLLLRQARMVQTLQKKFVEVPQSQFLPGCGRRCVYAAASCLATLKMPQKEFIAGVRGHFSRHRDRHAQLQLCMVGMVAAMRGSLLQFCSIFRPPSIWTLRPRVAGTPGV